MLAILDHERGVKILLYTFIGVQFLELPLVRTQYSFVNWYSPTDPIK